MRIEKNLEPQIVKGPLENNLPTVVLRKLGVFAMSKTCSPGRFPEGKVGESGRFPGRVFFRKRRCRNKFQSSYIYIYIYIYIIHIKTWKTRFPFIVQTGS